VSKRTKFLLGIGVIATLVIGFQVVAFANLPGSPFQGGDGNLVDDGVGIDWNSFDPIQWTGTAPNRLASENPTDKTDPLADGWQIVGKEDGEKNADTSGFAGGTKQDNNCPSVINTSSPNKDDLKRAYLSTKVLGGDTFLNLAWVRTKQNNTSASAHVGFEFNQGEVSCGASGLVNRVEDDLLIVYDFEGSALDPVISLRQWLPAGSTDACEVGSNSPPCWSEKTVLPAGTAEAKVNGPLTGVGTVEDKVAPTDETLGVSEFGEASINLTKALPDVFGEGTCTTFGKAEVVSRSSGNSEQATMMDLVGPVNFSLSNCGTIDIIKQTNPRGLNQEFDFTATANFTGTDLECSQASPETPTAFLLNDNGNTTTNSPANTQHCTGVPVGTYTFTETGETGFTLASITCSGGTTTVSVANRTAQITIAAGDSVTCTFVNDQNKQSILNTAQSFFPNDSATITGTNITGTGTVNFQLRKGTPTDCLNPPATDTKVYEQTVTPSGTPKTATTTNGDGTQPEFSLLAADAGSYYWRVFYDGPTGGDPDVLSCNEVNTVTINNGAEVKNPPSIN
jgi:Prealbumin-like fold domain